MSGARNVFVAVQSKDFINKAPVKYITNYKLSFCPETNPSGYIDSLKKTADSYGTWSNYRNVKQYNGDDWKERVIMDNYAYAYNYNCFQVQDITKTGQVRNQEAQKSSQACL